MKFRAIALVMLILGGFAISYISESGSTDSFLQEKLAWKEAPTPILVGLMTEKQKEHSKLYSRYKNNRKLDAPPIEGDPNAGTEMGVYIEPPLEVVAKDAPAITFEEFLTSLACDADAIAIVTVKDKVSQLTESKEFIFTDYTAAITEVFKNNSITPLMPSSIITITRPGGKVLIEGRIVGALDSSYLPFEINNQYLVFLKYIPATEAYESLRKGSFLLKDSELSKLTEMSIPGDGEGSRSLDKKARRAISTGCNK